VLSGIGHGHVLVGDFIRSFPIRQRPFALPCPRLRLHGRKSPNTSSGARVREATRSNSVSHSLVGDQAERGIALQLSHGSISILLSAARSRIRLPAIHHAPPMSPRPNADGSALPERRCDWDETHQGGVGFAWTHCWREPNSNHRSRSCELGPAPRPRYARDIMCGRARLSSDVSEIKLVFRVPPERPAPNFPPSWNVASTDTLPAVRYDARASERTLDVMRWGLEPFGRRTSKSDSRISTPKPRGSRASPPSARHFSGGAASFRWTISMPTRRSSKPCSRPTRRRRWSPGPSARRSATSRTMTRG
jgi:hypothetical protein